MAERRLIPVRVGEIEVLLVDGTTPTPGRVSKAARSVIDAFGRV